MPETLSMVMLLTSSTSLTWLRSLLSSSSSSSDSRILRGGAADADAVEFAEESGNLTQSEDEEREPTLGGHMGVGGGP